MLCCGHGVSRSKATGSEILLLLQKQYLNVWDSGMVVHPTLGACLCLAQQLEDGCLNLWLAGHLSEHCDCWWLGVCVRREAGYQVAFVVTPRKAHVSPGCVSIQVILFTVCSRCEDSSWVTLCGSNVTFAFSLTLKRTGNRFSQTASGCSKQGV